MYWLVYNLPAPEGLESFWVWRENAEPVVLIGKNLTDTQRLADIHTHRHAHKRTERWGLAGP